MTAADAASARLYARKRPLKLKRFANPAPQPGAPDKLIY